MTLTQLPEEEATYLKKLYESGDRKALKRHIAALRDKQWPLRAIGEPLGLSRSTIQFWERAADGGYPSKAVTLSPKAIETAGVKTVRWRTRIHPVHWEEFGKLAKSAQKVRSQTPEISQLREDAERLDVLIEYYLNKMVPVTSIAKAMGVTHRAVKARMERRDER